MTTYNYNSTLCVLSLNKLISQLIRRESLLLYSMLQRSYDNNQRQRQTKIQVTQNNLKAKLVEWQTWIDIDYC